MNKKKNIILFLTLTALIVWGLSAYRIYSGLKGNSSGKNGHFKDDGKGNASTGILPAIKPDFNIQGRDPFFPTPKAAPVVKDANKNAKTPPAPIQPPPWTLDGVIWNDKIPMAILRYQGSDRTEMVKKDAIIDSIRILQIEKDKVHVRFRDK